MGAIAQSPHSTPGNRPVNYSTIFRLALPTVIAMLSQSAVNEIDVIFFGRLPCPEASNAQAALLPSLIIVWLFGGSLSAISVGTQALTARRYAEGERQAAGAVLANSIAFSLIAGALLTVIGLLALRPLLSVMIRIPEVREIALTYSQWRLLGVISMAMTMGIKSFFDGIGRTHVHLWSALVMNAFNVLFCWMFIYGNWGAPRMGAEGAGLSAFLSTWIGLAIMLLFTAGAQREFRPMQVKSVSPSLMLNLLKLSVPAAIATTTMMLGFGLFSAIVGELDALSAKSAVSSMVESVCGHLEAVNGAATTNIVAVLKLTFTACIAFGTATATLVAQSLGAKAFDRAEKFGWASVRLGVMIFGVVALCEGVLFTKPIIDFFSQSEPVQAAVLVPLRMVAAATPIIAVAMILSEALFGAGNTKFVALAQLVLIFGVLLPLAYLFGVVMEFGLVGVFAAACVYFVLAAVTMTAKFRQGAWKHIVL